MNKGWGGWRCGQRVGGWRCEQRVGGMNSIPPLTCVPLAGLDRAKAVAEPELDDDDDDEAEEGDGEEAAAVPPLAPEEEEGEASAT